MMFAKDKDESRTVTGTIDLTLNLTDRRGIKVSGYIYSDDKPGDVHLRVDMLQDVLDRQYIRVDLVNKQAQLAGHFQNLENMKEAYAGLLAIQDAGKKLTSVQRQAFDNYARNVEHHKKEIASLEAAIAAGNKKLEIEA